MVCGRQLFSGGFGVMENRVTLYGNGIGDFRFVYDVTERGTTIEIPIRSQYLSDGINLFIQGASRDDRISLIESASFRPKQNGKDKIDITPTNVLESLCQKFRGARLKVNTTDKRVLDGLLFGLDKTEIDNGNYKIQQSLLSVYKDDGNIERVNLTDVVSYQFVQSDIRDTVQRILAESFAQIRPESSLIKMKVKSASANGRAIVGFTIPTAAWAMEYQIRRMGEIWRLTGSAIVHNNTDQPWENCVVTCVSGIPYTAEVVDLAIPEVPERNKVYVHAKKAVGGTEAPRAKGRGTPMLASASMREVRDTGEECSYSDFPSREPDVLGGGMVETTGADAIEVGDFAVLRPKDKVTIPSSSSSVIEVIGTDLKDCREELYYNFEQDEGKIGRPQMALRFTNPLPHSLQRGPCNVYNQFTMNNQTEDLFQGTAMLPMTKAKESRFLLYGQDTGIDVHRSGGRVDKKYTAVWISKGIVFTETTSRSAITYSIRSVKQQACEIVIDHNRVLPHADTRLTSDVPVEEETKTGNRYRLKVSAGQTVELKIVETHVESGRVDFNAGKLPWYRQTFIEQEHPAFKLTDGMDLVIAIQKGIEDIDSRINVLTSEVSALAQHQKELRANVEATKGSAHVTKFQNQLAENDDRIQVIKRTELPKVQQEREQAEKRLHDALLKVTLTWKE